MEDDMSLHQGEVQSRPMRVKILYSFDADNKTNCLARLPSLFQIPAVTIDERLKVGVIELKTCLQAVTTASPEILSNLSETDFIVYAFDFSEHDTPLVGQGMLSTAVTSMNVGVTEETMITGRICKNGPSLFNNGVAETLEVKLRLVPMRNNFAKPPSQSSERETSRGFDPNDWNATLEHSKLHTDDFYRKSNSQGRAQDSMNAVIGLEMGAISQSSCIDAIYDVGIGQTPTSTAMSSNPTAGDHAHSAPGSRSGSPLVTQVSSNVSMQMMQSNTRLLNDPSQPHNQTRPLSAGQHWIDGEPRQNRQASHPMLARTQSEQSATVFYHEDGRPRKRAKISQADWHGRGSFGTKSSDLRVTASTAASMHMHRPIPKKPSGAASELDPPPRVPTPVPQRTAVLPQQTNKSIPRARSLLRQASVTESDILSEYESQFSDAIMSSPEGNSPGNNMTADGTPCEIPSSPPVFADVYLPPSSPGLPSFPQSRPADSGYMSERGLSSSNMSEGLELGKFDQQNATVWRSGHSRATSTQPFIKNESSVVETPVSFSSASTPAPGIVQPGSVAAKRSHMSQSISSKRNTQNCVSTAAGTEQENHHQPSNSRRSSLALPPVPTRDHKARDVNASQRIETNRSLARQASRSRSSYEPEGFSPAPSDSEGGLLQGPKRSGSGAARRRVIKERLERSIANGDMPQFCHHCGAIETPTWRKLYVKFVDGKPSPLDYAEGEGETIGVESLEKDEDGEVTRFVIRKSMKRTKDFTPGPGFQDISVCNPCGLWFGKFRSMRPADKWHKKSATRKSKKRIVGEEGFTTEDMELQSEPSFCFTQDHAIASFESLGPLEQDKQMSRLENSSGGILRASSVQPAQAEQRHMRSAKASALNKITGREIQSSPVRRCGSQDSPIDIDETSPKPTRRLLFPSPRREGEVKNLHDGPSRAQSSEKITPIKETSGKPGNNDYNTFSIFLAHKENIDPVLPAENDEFAGLFDGSPAVTFKTPTKSGSKKTTPRSHRFNDHLLKTPTPRNVQSNSSDGFADDIAHDFLISPSASRYFLRSTPSRQERTPRQHSSRGCNGPTEISPFSRHLAQMLSDTTEPVAFTSPPRAFDFNDLPTFNTPGRHIDWAGLDEMLSSEFPILDDVTNHAF